MPGSRNSTEAGELGQGFVMYGSWVLLPVDEQRG